MQRKFDNQDCFDKTIKIPTKAKEILSINAIRNNCSLTTYLSVIIENHCEKLNKKK